MALLLAASLAGCRGIRPGNGSTATLPVAVSRAVATNTRPAATPSLTPVFTVTQRSTFTPTGTATRAPFVYAFGPTGFPPDVNPLTGLPVSPASLLERRPVVVKVTNFPRTVRPQWGLALADHIYEYYIADEMSRFIGVFYGNDASRVGPVRSARLFDARVMRMYNGIFIFGWADDPILEFLLTPDLQNFLVVERPGNCPPLCRIGSENAYNTLYADTAQIGAYLAAHRTSNERQNLNGLRFELQTPPSGNPGRTLSIEYSLVSYHRWEYDLPSGRYLRFQESEDQHDQQKSFAPLMDSLTQTQLSANNLIVLLIPHTYYLKSSSTEIFDQPLDEGGTGYAFRDGQLYPITWNQPAPNQLLQFTLPNGQNYPLKPGNVWFEVLGTSSTFSELESGAWHFSFKVP